MIIQGTDSVLRGDMQKGSLLGKPMQSFAPLHLTTLERCSSLKRWLESWLDSNPFFLSPS